MNEFDQPTPAQDQPTELSSQDQPAPAMPNPPQPAVQVQKFNQLFHYLLGGSFVLGLLYFQISRFRVAPAVGIIIGIAILLGCAIAYVAQCVYIRRNYPKHKLTHQFILIGCAFLLPIIAGVIGHYNGVSAFGLDKNVGFTGYLGIWIGLYLAFVGTYIFAFANLIFIQSRGVNTVLKVLGWIVYVLLWLVALYVSFFSYSIAYSAHDPNAE